MSDDLIKRLEEEALALHGFAIGRGNAGASISGMLADEAATALAEAQATIARQQALLDRALEDNGDMMVRIGKLETLLREAFDTLDDGWGTEQVTKEAAEEYFGFMSRLKSALPPKTPDTPG